MAKRLSLVERQQKLLEEKGFSKPAPAPVGTKNKPLLSRSDEQLIRQGRGVATAASRRAVPMVELEVATRRTTFSAAPSLHPSLAHSGVAQSVACSETTIGAGDDTPYWDYQHRQALRSDLGHMCRECRKPFTRVGEPITERRGSRISTRYHAECFSGYADPRSQARSSTHEGNLVGTQYEAAPDQVFNKMRTGSHFSSGSTGKSVGAQMAMGRLGFARSSRGQGMHGVAGGGGGSSAESSAGIIGGGATTSNTNADPSALTADKLKMLDEESGKRGSLSQSTMLERIMEEPDAGPRPQASAVVKVDEIVAQEQPDPGGKLHLDSRRSAKT
eukprot:g10288.t1